MQRIDGEDHCLGPLSAARAGSVATRSAAGRIVGGYAIDDDDLDLAGADIDLDHNGGAIGTVIYAEVGRAN